MFAVRLSYLFSDLRTVDCFAPQTRQWRFATGCSFILEMCPSLPRFTQAQAQCVSGVGEQAASANGGLAGGLVLFFIGMIIEGSRRGCARRSANELTDFQSHSVRVRIEVVAGMHTMVQSLQRAL